MINSAATVAFGCPTSLGLYRRSWSQQAASLESFAPLSPKQELPVQVGDVDRVHVNNVNVPEA